MSETKLERAPLAGSEPVPARPNEGGQAQQLKEVAGTFLKLGAFGYGGQFLACSRPSCRSARSG